MIFSIVANIINTVASLFILVVIVDSILTYFLSTDNPVRNALDRVVIPFLAPIRRVVPPLGMFDLSPLILIVLVEILSSIHGGKRGAALAVRVTPRATKNEIIEVMNDGTIKVHLTAPPVDGKANEALLKFMAGILEIPKSRLEVVAGAGGRDKIISVIDMDADTLQKKVAKFIK